MAAPADEQPEPRVLSEEQLDAATRLATREHYCRCWLANSLAAYSALPLSCSFAERRGLSLEIQRCCLEYHEILGELLSLEACISEEHDGAPEITWAR